MTQEEYALLTAIVILSPGNFSSKIKYLFQKESMRSMT